MEDKEIVSSGRIMTINSGCTMVLELPKDDPFFDEKKVLLLNKGFHIRESVQLERTTCPDSIATVLDEMLEMLRVILLDEVELYFGETDELISDEGCSRSIEVDALNSILSLVNSSIASRIHLEINALEALRDAVIDRIQKSVGQKKVLARIDKGHPCGHEKALVEWGESNGVKTRLEIACVEGAGRGAIATTDLKVGEVALEIPVSILISEELVFLSEMYHILEKIHGISLETIMLLWSMKERHNSDSKFRMYFDTLPKKFNTGLSFGFDAIMMLDGTLLLEEILQAKEHLRVQYDELVPALCKKHPDLFPLELYTWEQYLWACELWYSNSMKILFPDGMLKTCLIPIAGFLNHSLNPHIIHYGKVDSETSMLKFPLSRPCHAGEQCFLSYGNFSSSHLITFYGFMPQGENRYDVIPLDIDIGEADNIEDSPMSSWTTHMVRGAWLSGNHGLFHYGLPSPLLDHLRRARSPHTKTITQANLEIEMEVLEDLQATFSSMMEALGDGDLVDRQNTSWDVKLALEFKDLQRRIVSSSLTSCNAGAKLVRNELLQFMSVD